MNHFPEKLSLGLRGDPIRILLDTCTFLWLVTDAPDLSETAKAAYLEASNEVFLSSVSCWEIAVKYALKRLSLPDSPDKFIPKLRDNHHIDSLSLDEASVLHSVRLPLLHKDPFDRMLVSQALCHGFTILTPDPLILKYPVRTYW